RPAMVDERSRVGDWEADLVLGKQGTGAIVTLWCFQPAECSRAQRCDQRQQVLIAGGSGMPDAIRRHNP
ncbi:hypothetical protein EWM60_18390, partial [Candidatus Erwinia dacicola]|nr:hypothetical protein [Candidatus Erwinia dacicola]